MSNNGIVIVIIIVKYIITIIVKVIVLEIEIVIMESKRATATVERAILISFGVIVRL